MHIHPSSPQSSEEDAATKIQAGFRGYRVRKQIRQGKGGASGGAGSSTGSGSGSGTGKAGAKKGSGSVEENSATKIQAGVRGFLVRKRQKAATDAATKIQASFRGFKTRKELNKSGKKEK